LFIASYEGHIRVVKYLLSKGANIELVDTHDGGTPVLGSIKNNHFEVLKVLAANGANVNQANLEGLTPLISAIVEGHVLIVKFLLSENANIEQIGKNQIGKEDVNDGTSVTDLGFFSPLIAACMNACFATAVNEKKCMKICHILLKHGASVSKTVTLSDGIVMSPLGLASAKSCTKLCRLLTK
jgi:ankyrin repeat protein